MSDLPNRQWFRDHAGVMLTYEDDAEEWEVVAAYVRKELRTAEEFNAITPDSFEKMAGRMAQAMDSSEWYTKRYVEAERLLAIALELPR